MAIGDGLKNGMVFAATQGTAAAVKRLEQTAGHVGADGHGDARAGAATGSAFAGVFAAWPVVWAGLLAELDARYAQIV
jgi:hypothetical protein